MRSELDPNRVASVWIWSILILILLGLGWWALLGPRASQVDSADRSVQVEEEGQGRADLENADQLSRSASRLEVEQEPSAYRSVLSQSSESPGEGPDWQSLLTEWFHLIEKHANRDLRHLWNNPKRWKRADLRPLRDRVISSGHSASALLEPEMLGALETRSGVEARQLRATARAASLFAPGFTEDAARALSRTLALGMHGDPTRFNWSDFDRGSALFALLHRDHAGFAMESYSEMFVPLPADLDGPVPASQHVLEIFLGFTLELDLDSPTFLVDPCLELETFRYTKAEELAWCHKVRTQEGFAQAETEALGLEPRKPCYLKAVGATRLPSTRGRLLELATQAQQDEAGYRVRGAVACGLLSIGDPASRIDFEDLFQAATGPELQAIEETLREDLTLPAAVRALQLLSSRVLDAEHRDSLIEVLQAHVLPLSWSPLLSEQRREALVALDRAEFSYTGHPEVLARLAELRSKVE